MQFYGAIANTLNGEYNHNKKGTLIDNTFS